MDPKRTLVVYYSRTGTTRSVARAIQEELGCEIERITDTKHRGGVLGWMRSAVDAILHRPAALRAMSTDPADYELVILGSPVWNASVSAPVRTYLEENGDRIRRVAFFCTFGTFGGRGSARALRQMEAACRKRPIATLGLREKDVDRRAFVPRVQTFVGALGSGAAHEEHPEPPPELRPVPA
jgi:flavodoxin